jgi:hypothetical protein
VWGQLSFAGTATNTSIGSLRTMLTGVGWTQPTLTDGDLDGTLAMTTIVPDGFPYHATGTDPCVPDILGAALVGAFGGYYFIFFDPYSSTPPQVDPTGSIFDGLTVIGVPCATSAIGTQNNFATLAEAWTPWTWTFVTMSIPFVGDVLTAVVIAKHTGPSANVDPSSPDGWWSPGLDNWFLGTDAPSGGGWNVYTEEAPNTDDVIRLRLYETNNDGGMGIDVVMPYGYLQSVPGTGDNYVNGGYAWDLTTPGGIQNIVAIANATTGPIVIETSLAHGFKVGDYVFLTNINGISYLSGTFCISVVPSTTTFQLAQVYTFGFTITSTDTRTGESADAVFNIGAGPYQIAIGLKPYTSTDLGGTSMLAAALNVPSAMGPASVSVTGVPTLTPAAIIQTSAAHGLTVGDRVQIQNIVGPTNLNGSWWVARVPATNKLEISDAPLSFIFGNGDAYTTGGSVMDETTLTGPFTISAVTNTTGSPVVVTTATAHGFIPGDVVAISGVGGATNINGTWTVGEVLSTTAFEIAMEDMGVQVADTAYISGGTIASGIFNACFATSQIIGGGLAGGNLYDDGQNTVVACQGIWGTFNSNARTLAAYSVALPCPFQGTGGDGNTTADKPLILAPYVSLRIANGQEARIAGTLWDSYIQLQNSDYGSIESYQGTPFFAWVANENESTFFNATLWIRAQST